MIGRILLEVSVIFVVFWMGYVMGFKACSRYILDAAKENKRKND